MATPLKIEKERPEKKQKTLPSFSLIIALVFLLFVVGAYFLVWPAYEGLTAKKEKLESQKILLQTQNEYFGNLQKLISDFKAMKEGDKEKLSMLLPNEIDEPGLFVLFESLTAKNNMAVLAIDISEKEPSQELKNLGIKEVSIALNIVGGSYADLKSFLDDLESNIRLIDIVAINYTPEANSYILNIKTYRLESQL